jgi:hypothetical protein
MKIFPRNLLLFLLLALLVVANLYLEGASREGTEGGALFPGLDPAQAARLEIAVPTEEGERRLTIARRGDHWVLSDRGDFPVLEGRVEGLLKRVALLSRADRVGESAASHESFGVGAGARRLGIFDAEGNSLAEFRQGAGPEGGAGGHVRPVGEDAVYRSSSLSSIEANPAVWLDTHLIEFDSSRVERIRGSCEEEGISLELVREADGRWGPPDAASPDRRIAPAVVGRLLQTASLLYFSEISPLPPDAASGFDPPRLSLEFDLGEGESVGLWIGAAVEEDRCLATNPRWEGAWAVLLPDASFARLASAMRSIDAARR